MHKVEFYQLLKSGRWRWKLSFNGRVLARGDNHYAKKSGARKAFLGIRTAIVTNGVVGYR